VPLTLVEQAFTLYRETYFDLNVRHFHDKSWARDEVQLSHVGEERAARSGGPGGCGAEAGAALAPARAAACARMLAIPSSAVAGGLSTMREVARANSAQVVGKAKLGSQRNLALAKTSGFRGPGDPTIVCQLS